MPVWANHETISTDDMHAHVSIHVSIHVNFRKDMCFGLFSLAVVIGKGLGQVHGFSVVIT